MAINITRTQTPKPKPIDESKLVFGRTFTDHMFMFDYNNKDGWHGARVVPNAPIAMDPATAILHYGQEVFEGLKAYRRVDGRVGLFRPADNIRRMNASAARLAMAELPVDEALEGLYALIRTESDWVPSSEGTSLYIRPNIIAMDAALGVHASSSYLFYIICCPVGPYYASGFKPVAIYVEDEYVRAVRGGVGFTKAGGNYAASLLAGTKAEAMGYTQVLWLDALERRYVEEVGAMNMFFVINDTLVTPALKGSILPGITRDSVIKLAGKLGYKVEERPIAIEEVFEAHEKGTLTEAFGSGTAAVISPVGVLGWKDKKIELGGNEVGPIARALYDTLTGIQYGKLPDDMGWTVTL